MPKNFLYITLNILFVIIILEFVFKIYNLSQPDYFDNKKNIIWYYLDFTNHSFIGYTAIKNTASKQIHYEPWIYFQTTTNSDSFWKKIFTIDFLYL